VCARSQAVTEREIMASSKRNYLSLQEMDDVPVEEMSFEQLEAHENKIKKEAALVKKRRMEIQESTKKKAELEAKRTSLIDKREKDEAEREQCGRTWQKHKLREEKILQERAAKIDKATQDIMAEYEPVLITVRDDRALVCVWPKFSQTRL